MFPKSIVSPRTMLLLLKTMIGYWMMLSLLYMAHSQHMGPVCTTTTRPHTIIDIKSSIAHNATLINGSLEQSLSDCIQKCCEIDQCDLAVFKNNGTSPSNHNCYIVRCGVDQNCILVRQPHFTTVSLNKGIYIQCVMFISLFLCCMMYISSTKHTIRWKASTVLGLYTFVVEYQN